MKPFIFDLMSRYQPYYFLGGCPTPMLVFFTNMHDAIGQSTKLATEACDVIVGKSYWH